MMKKQGFVDSFNVDKGESYNVVEGLGCIQIDTINVVERAHHLTLWTRVGNYDKNHLCELAYEDRLLFEYWAHAASYIPFKDYRFYLQPMKARRREAAKRFTKRTGISADKLCEVLNKIKRDGPLSSGDFEGKRLDDGWGNYKPANLAMRLLFNAGVLLVHHRENFQKYFDLAEKIIPSWVDTEPPSEEERILFFTKKTLECLGLVKPQEVKNYYYDHSVKLGRSTKDLQKLLDRLNSYGEVARYEVDWDKHPYYCLVEDVDLLDELSEGFMFDGVKIVGYFDNFMWMRDRIHQLFDFESKLEIYTPKIDRVYGYYHFPVLYRDKLVARIEPRMDRENKILRILGYWLEDGFTHTEEYEDKLHDGLESFANFNGANEIIWDTTFPRL